MSTDLTTAAARTQRDQLASRVDVLDKVGVLRALPDDVHVTTDMVAEFYAVPKETVFTLVRNNRDEIEEDGYRVVTRAAFEGTFKTKVPSSASRIALFPRRAVLRVGMLLRDSDVAKRVRTHLLDVEEDMRIDLSDPIAAIEQQMRLTAKAVAVAKDERAKRIVLEAKVDRDRPFVERAKSHETGRGDKTRQQFFRELKQWGVDHDYVVKQSDVMAFLSTKKLGLFIAGNRGDSGQATSWALDKGYARNPEGTAENGFNFIRSMLTPKGQAYAWDRCVRFIEDHGSLSLNVLVP